MVSLQPTLAPEEKKTSCPHLEDFLPKKRKRSRDEEDGQGCNGLVRESKLAKAEEDIDLHLGTPLPLEWQQCLDIQSGEIHFYNTSTHKRTTKDPRLVPEPAPAAALQKPISLDLELNLACEPRRSEDGDEEGKEGKNGKHWDDKLDSTPWTSLEVDRREMVATVCIRCHMLVMMCKAALSCPNCKFLHPPSHRLPASSTSIKPTFNLLYCMDQWSSCGRL